MGNAAVVMVLVKKVSGMIITEYPTIPVVIVVGMGKV
jgi:hypothetical protein